MSANFVTAVSSLVYGDLAAADLGPAPAGSKNHLDFTLDWVLSPLVASAAGTQFLSHHLDVLLERYEAWRSLYLLPALHEASIGATEYRLHRCAPASGILAARGSDWRPQG